MGGLRRAARAGFHSRHCADVCIPFGFKGFRLCKVVLRFSGDISRNRAPPVKPFSQVATRTTRRSFWRKFPSVFFLFTQYQIYVVSVTHRATILTRAGPLVFSPGCFELLFPFFSISFPFLNSRNNRGGGGFKYYPRGHRQLGWRGL